MGITIDKKLTSYLNGLVPLFREETHKYFQVNFLDDFSWEDSKQLIEYYVEENIWSGGCIDSKGNLGLDGGKRLFNEGKITGEGVWIFFHEISHCWLKYKGYQDQIRNSGNGRINYALIEGFCDFSSSEIIKRTKIRHLFPESLKYSEELDKVYSYLIDSMKSGDSFEPIKKDFSEEHIFGLGDILDFNRPLKARVYGILSCYENQTQREEILREPPRNMGELIGFVPKINSI